MLFLDKKEEVLDIKLTQFGKYKLSVGEFNPTYYAFFDGDVLYDPDCAELSGSQNSIEGRIQENTPRLQSQHVFEGRETAILRGNEISDLTTVASRKAVTVVDTLNGDVVAYPDAQLQQLQAYYQQNYFQKYQYMIETTTRDRHYSLTAPLGTSDLSSQKAPKWKVSLFSGQIDNAARVLTGSYQTEQIPQVNITLTYDTMVANVDSSKNTLSLEGTDPELSSDVFPDGTYIAVRPEHLLAEIKEEYANYTNENFDIEIMVKDNQVVPNISGSAGSEVPYFKYLYFEPEEVTIKDGILLDEPIMPAVKDVTDETRFASYFVDVLVDDEIDRTIICNAIDKLKAEDIHIDSEYECPDTIGAINASIYNPTAAACPADSDSTSSTECEV